MPTSLTYNEGDYSLDGLLTGSVAVNGDDGASTVGWVPTSGFITRHFVSSPPYQYMEHFLGLLNPRWRLDPPYLRTSICGGNFTFLSPCFPGRSKLTSISAASETAVKLRHAWNLVLGWVQPKQNVKMSKFQHKMSKFPNVGVLGLLKENAPYILIWGGYTN